MNGISQRMFTLALSIGRIGRDAIEVSARREGSRINFVDDPIAHQSRVARAGSFETLRDDPGRDRLENVPSKTSTRKEHFQFSFPILIFHWKSNARVQPLGTGRSDSDATKSIRQVGPIGEALITP